MLELFVTYAKAGIPSGNFLYFGCGSLFMGSVGVRPLHVFFVPVLISLLSGFIPSIIIWTVIYFIFITVPPVVRGSTIFTPLCI